MPAVKRAEGGTPPAHSSVPIRGIFILCAIGAIYIARDFLLPVVLAAFIAFTFRPTIHWLARHNVPAWLSATGFAISSTLIVFAAAYFASQPISGWINDAPELERIFMEKIRNLRASIDGVIHLTRNLEEAATTPAAPNVQEVVVKESGWQALLTFVVGYPANFIVTLSGALVLAVFFMASGDLFYEKLVRVLPTLADKKNALRIAYDVEREISNYLVTVTAINAGLAIAVAVIFYFLGMPTPYLWALLAFILNFIPYVGPIVGTSLAAVVGLVMFDSLGYALLPPLAYACLIGLETQIITPSILGRRLALNSVAILLALAFWAWAWGIAGIIVAVPLLVTLRVFCSHLDSMSALGEFLGESISNGSTSQDAETLPEGDKLRRTG